MRRSRFLFGSLIPLTLLGLLTPISGQFFPAASATPCVPATLTIDHDNTGIPVVHAVGDPALAYELQANADLVGFWVPLAPFTGSIDYVDADAPLLPKRFYRAVCLDGAMLSQNAVGYVKDKPPAGSKRSMVSGCFNAPGGLPPTVSQLLGGQIDGQIPAGVTVHVWNGTTFESALRGASGWINDPIVMPGHGFWIDVDDTAPPQDIYIVGEVPTQEVIVINGIQNDLLGLPYPVEVFWEDTTLAGVASLGSTLTIFDGLSYLDFSKTFMGWSGAPVTLSAGEGFFFSTGATLNSNICTKPYDWP